MNVLRTRYIVPPVPNRTTKIHSLPSKIIQLTEMCKKCQKRKQPGERLSWKISNSSSSNGAAAAASHTCDNQHGKRVNRPNTVREMGKQAKERETDNYTCCTAVAIAFSTDGMKRVWESERDRRSRWNQNTIGAVVFVLVDAWCHLTAGIASDLFGGNSAIAWTLWAFYSVSRSF